MKKFLSLFLGVFIALPAVAFEYTYEGQTLNYEILDEDAKTAKVSFNSNFDIKGAVVIPAEVTLGANVYSVTQIGRNAFINQTELTSVIIPNSVETIEQLAFMECTGLTSITIPNSVATIDYEAFYKCSGLISLTLPNSLDTISWQAFLGCTSLTSLTIPNSVISIGGGAFYGCTGLTSLTLPNSVTTIGDEAFYGCTGLTSLTIPNSVTTVGGGAFYGCTGLTSLTIPNSVISIDAGAFYGCTGLTSLTIPNSVTTIGDSAFSNCSALTSVTISNSVISIGAWAFQYCSALTSVTIPGSVTSVGEGAFCDCDNLTTVTFENPNDDLTLEDAMRFKNVSQIEFTGNFTLKKSGNFGNLFDQSTPALYFDGNYIIEDEVFAGNSIQYTLFGGKSDIGYKAFYNCNVARVYLEDCQGIEDYAFATDKYPYTNFMLWCFNDKPPYVASSNVFSGLPKSRYYNSRDTYSTIYVPSESLDAYQKAYGWDYFYQDVLNGMGTLNDLVFTPETVHLDLRKSVNITYNADTAGDYEMSNISWSSSDENVAAVNSSGTVQAKANGMALIYFSWNHYGLATTIGATLVTVGDVDFSLELNPLKEAISSGETTMVNATYGGQGYKVVSEKWSSSNEEIATVNQNGEVTGLAIGDATIKLTVTFDNGISWTVSCTVNVTSESGIDEIQVEGSGVQTEYYNLNGLRVNGDNLAPGIYIKRQGSKTEKILVK